VTLTARDRVSLLGYRLRPLEPVTLVVAIVAAIVVGALMIPGGPPAPPNVARVSDVSTPLTAVAMALALTTGFVAGRDVDAAEPLLSSAPVAFRRALALRVGLWAVVRVALVASFAGRAAGVLESAPDALRGRALVQLLFVGAATLAASRAWGSLAGGGAVLAAIGLIAGVPFVYEGFPIELLAGPGTAEWRTTAVRLEVVSVALVAAVWWRSRP
jgi:hypothetical protein